MGNVAPVEGLRGHHSGPPGTIAYNVAKAAVVNMTLALAAKWGPRNIRVDALAPGFFPSKMTKALLEQHGDEVPRGPPLLGTLGSYTDLVGAALLLGSDAGGHIMGRLSWSTAEPTSSDPSALAYGESDAFSRYIRAVSMLIDRQQST